MSESRPNKAVTDEELIGVITAISVVSRRLARKLIHLNQTSQSQEGGKQDEQNERNGNDHQRVTGWDRFVPTSRYLFKRVVLSVRNKDADESTSLAGTVTFGRERVGKKPF